MEIVFDKTKKVLLLLVLTLLFISITTSVFAAKSFNLNIASATIYEGKVFCLTAVGGNSVTWKSSDDNKATVDKSGKVTAKKEGTVTITATDKNGETESCEIKIKKQGLFDRLRGDTMNASSVTMYEGENIVLSANGAYNWKTTNKIATKVVAGRTGAVKRGIAIISAKTSKGKTVTCWVTVKKYKEEVQAPTPAPQPVKVEKIALDKTSVNLEAEKELQLTATVSPSNAASKTVKWDSSNKNVATVNSSGKVKANAVGTTTITATANDGSGVKGSCTITVTAKVETLKITGNNNDKPIGIGETVTLTANKEGVKWEIKNDDGVLQRRNDKKADADLKENQARFVAKKLGTATIKATKGDETTIYTVRVTTDIYTPEDYKEVYNYQNGNKKYDQGSWASLPELDSNYIIAIGNKKLNAVIKTIVDNRILQSRGGNCHKIGIYEIGLLVGTKAEGTASHTAAKMCGDKYKGQMYCTNEKEMLKQIKGWIDQGKPVLLHVKSNTDEHWVTVVGYKQSGCNDIKDLLILGPTFGTLQKIDAVKNRDGTYSGGTYNEVQRGLYGDGDIRVYN